MAAWNIREFGRRRREKASLHPAGNRERIAYVYDQRKCAFTGLAAEADPPRKKDPKTKEYVSKIDALGPPAAVGAGGS